MPVRKIKRYGWIKSLPDIRDHKYVIPAHITTLPPLIDLRAECPPVYDQGNLGSCTANASAGAFEFDLKKQGLTDFQPSRLFIYYNERKLENNIKTDSGAELRDAAKTLNKQGVCDENKWPYVVSQFASKPSAACYTAGLKNMVVSYLSLDNTDINQLKSSLVSGVPFIFGFTVYDSFESAAVTKTGKVPIPKSKEKVLGGHAVMAVGYDDSKQVFIIRNSWGSGWGVKGYGYMPYAYLTNPNLAADFWQLTSVT